MRLLITGVGALFMSMCRHACVNLFPLCLIPVLPEEYIRTFSHWGHHILHFNFFQMACRLHVSVDALGNINVRHNGTAIPNCEHIVKMVYESAAESIPIRSGTGTARETQEEDEIIDIETPRRPTGPTHRDQPTTAAPEPGLTVTLTSGTVPIEGHHIYAGFSVRTTRKFPAGTRFAVSGPFITKNPRERRADHRIVQMSQKRKLDLRDPSQCNVLRYVQYAPSESLANTAMIIDGESVCVEAKRDIQPWEELTMHWGEKRSDPTNMKMGMVWAHCQEMTPRGEHDKTSKLYTAPSTLKVYKGCFELVNPGLGVFAHTFIANKEPMGVYLGDKGTYKQMKREESVTGNFVDETFIFSLNSKEYINAMDSRTSSIIRYINDPLIPEAYNMEYVVEEHGDNIYAIATRDIHPGEEIFGAYGDNALTNVWTSIKKQKQTPETRPKATLVFHEHDGNPVFSSFYDRALHYDPCFNTK